MMPKREWLAENLRNVKYWLFAIALQFALLRVAGIEGRELWLRLAIVVALLVALKAAGWLYRLIRPQKKAQRAEMTDEEFAANLDELERTQPEKYREFVSMLERNNRISIIVFLTFMVVISLGTAQFLIMNGTPAQDAYTAGAFVSVLFIVWVLSRF